MPNGDCGPSTSFRRSSATCSRSTWREAGYERPRGRPRRRRLGLRLPGAGRRAAGAGAGGARRRAAVASSLAAGARGAVRRRPPRPRRAAPARDHALAAPALLRLLRGHCLGAGDPGRAPRGRAQPGRLHLAYLAGLDRARSRGARLAGAAPRALRRLARAHRGHGLDVDPRRARGGAGDDRPSGRRLLRAGALLRRQGGPAARSRAPQDARRRRIPPAPGGAAARVQPRPGVPAHLRRGRQPLRLRAGARPALPLAQALGGAPLLRARGPPGPDPGARAPRCALRELDPLGRRVEARRPARLLARVLPARRLRRGERGAARARQPDRRALPLAHEARRPARPPARGRQPAHDGGRRPPRLGGSATRSEGGGLRMLVSTTNELPGQEIVEVLGEVMGLTVRSRNIGSQLGASFKSILGGELKGMTKALIDSRNDVMQRMIEEAEAKGADAIVAMRFDTSEMGSNWTEICAYGTAVRTSRA